MAQVIRSIRFEKEISALEFKLECERMLNLDVGVEEVIVSWSLYKSLEMICIGTILRSHFVRNKSILKMYGIAIRYSPEASKNVLTFICNT